MVEKNDIACMEQDMRKVAVVVPVYKRQLSDLEQISFRQLIHILGTFEIIIAAPENIELPEEIVKEKLKAEYFSESHFSSVASYSRLMMSAAFYERFVSYEYILIYQLDAFVFSDQLLYFCNLGFDYIGAPWIPGICNYAKWKRKIKCVGNGGLSLRKVKACISVLNQNKDLSEQYKNQNEDGFFTVCDGRNFRVAPREVALSFSIESDVRNCFEKNHKKLPFGCHAWERYDLKFWKPYIEKFGYVIDEQKLKGGREDEQNQGKDLWTKRYAELLEKDDLFFSIPDKIRSLFGSKANETYLIWGAGRRGKWVKSLLSDSGVQIGGFIDTSQEKQGLCIEGVMVYDPGKINLKNKIIIAVKDCEGIEKKLKDMNLEYQRQYILFDDILPEIER